MVIPDKIRQMTEGKSSETDSTGMSDASVTVYDDRVLKIAPYRERNAQTVEVMRWLKGKLPVPEVLCYESDGEHQFLLMSRIRGKMACDEYWMSRPDELVPRLAEALRMLWSVDVSDCPRVRDIDAELAEAEYRVEHGMVDLDNVEPSTFGEGGFRDPEELLQWLRDNRPQYDPVLSHGDFCLPNIFLDERGISGFIDLGETGVGDRYRDIALCYRSLRWNAEGAYGGNVYPDIRSMALFDALGMEPDMEKIRYYLLLDELF